jgi:PEP-CTERM motif
MNITPIPEPTTGGLLLAGLGMLGLIGRKRLV